MNPFISNFSPGLKLLFLFAFFITGTTFGGLMAIGVGTGVFGIPMEEVAQLYENPTPDRAEALRWVINATQFGTFILPVLVFLVVFGAPHIRDMGLRKISWLALTVPIWIAFSGGMIDLIGIVNSWLIPEGGHLEAILKPIESQTAEITRVILSETSPISLLSTLFAIAVIPALSEELFFRGTLQPLLIRATGRPHEAIWITAILFSFIHFQFYGFLPRVLLGAMLGYAVYWSGSLWTSIIAHFINNALAAIFFHINGQQLTTPEGSFQDSAVFYVLSAAIFFGVGFLLWKNFSKNTAAIR
ncbi:MAG: CPBP family intramembrane metalloprotease [Crocinitomicaceae bacterium]|nr:CPBP family intramembrane metalloprotease [Crocinitomicaceae bacterium]